MRDLKHNQCKYIVRAFRNCVNFIINYKVEKTINTMKTSESKKRCSLHRFFVNLFFYSFLSLLLVSFFALSVLALVVLSVLSADLLSVSLLGECNPEVERLSVA